MNCYHCDERLTSATHVTWGNRTVLVCKPSCNRDALVGYAERLGIFGEPEQCTDQQLIDAIAAEKLSGEFLDRLDRLPTEQAQRDAIHRLRLSIEGTQHEDS